MKRFVVLFIVLSILVGTSNYAGGEWNVYFKVEDFTWKEYNNGSRILKESSPLNRQLPQVFHSIGISVEVPVAKIHNQLICKGKAEILNGIADYDGQTFSGNPVKTATDYRGKKLEADIGWKIGATPELNLKPFAGIGYTAWYRTILSKANVKGYQETWQSYYLRLGIYGKYAFSGRLALFSEAEARIPIDNDLKADLKPDSPVFLDPGKKSSFSIEAGIKWSLLKASLFYENMRFSESEVYDDTTIYQPKSVADIYGVNVGISF